MFLAIPHHLTYTRLLHGSETVCRHQKWFFTIFGQTEAGNVIKPLIRIIKEKNNLYIYVFAHAVIMFILCFIAANIAIFLSWEIYHWQTTVKLGHLILHHTGPWYTIQKKELISQMSQSKESNNNKDVVRNIYPQRSDKKSTIEIVWAHCENGR